MKITKPPTEVYRTSFTRFYTYIVTHKKIVVKTLYFSLICESVGITRLLIFYNFVTILLLGFLYVFRRYGYTIYISYSAFIFTLSMYTDLGLLFSCLGVVLGMCLGTRWENIVSSFLLAPPTHTTHTYTHIKWCVVFRYPGGGNVLLTCVCALAEGVHKR